MRDRIIDTVIHPYTGKQILATLLDLWQEDRDGVVILLADKGETQWKVKALRIALSKERKQQGKSTYFGLVTGEPFKWTHGTIGSQVEAIGIYYRQTKRQRLGYILDTDVATTLMADLEAASKRIS